jgi:hypothetical protein
MVTPSVDSATPTATPAPDSDTSDSSSTDDSEGEHSISKKHNQTLLTMAKQMKNDPKAELGKFVGVHTSNLPDSH